MLRIRSGRCITPPMSNATNAVSRRLVEVAEPFTFRDGTRLAWVTWLVGGLEERRCVSVREFDAGPTPAPTPKAAQS